jgi:glycosyltransferase involved in cell wall biosynthesis
VFHICIPVYNEAPTVGVLLWRIRQVFQDFPREYEITVHDDASSDATAETLEPYQRVMPLTVIRGETRIGMAAAVDSLLRNAARKTRYPRRDAAIVMQADFTDQPEHLPEMVKRFEGGADLVVAERAPAATGTTLPTPVRRLQWVAPWVLRPFVSVPGVRDPFRSFRLYRIQLLRDLIREAGDGPLMRAEGWAGNVDLLLRATRAARRMETVELSPRYDLRPRDSRVRPWDDALSLYRFGRAARARRVPDVPLTVDNQS